MKEPMNKVTRTAAEVLGRREREKERERKKRANTRTYGGYGGKLTKWGGRTWKHTKKW